MNEMYGTQVHVDRCGLYLNRNILNVSRACSYPRIFSRQQKRFFQRPLGVFRKYHKRKRQTKNTQKERKNKKHTYYNITTS